MDLKDTIIKQLAAPVKRKGTQELMTDEEGNIVTSEAAIGMTIVQKALSGDLQAVAFVLNLQMQHERDPKTEAEDADRRRQQTEQMQAPGIKFERSRQTGSGVSLRAKTNTNYTN